jgi:hypothetical protein
LAGGGGGGEQEGEANLARHDLVEKVTLDRRKSPSRPHPLTP